ncbi:MAG: hypothetical protein ABIS01_11775, partial [Ferruginibacter sp.]
KVIKNDFSVRFLSYCYFSAKPAMVTSKKRSVSHNSPTDSLAGTTLSFKISVFIKTSKTPKAPAAELFF